MMRPHKVDTLAAVGHTERKLQRPRDAARTAPLLGSLSSD